MTWRYEVSKANISEEKMTSDMKKTHRVWDGNAGGIGVVSDICVMKCLLRAAEKTHIHKLFLPIRLIL